MDESTVNGLVIGVVFCLIGAAAALVWKIFRSPSEGARRLSWVITGAAALFVGACILAAGGITALLITAGIIGLTIWVVRGYRRGSPPKP